MTYPFFQKIAKIHQKAWEVTPHVFHHPWHIYLMDFYPFFSSSKDFTFDFSMSHCYTRYRSEEISPGAATTSAAPTTRRSSHCSRTPSSATAPPPPSNVSVLQQPSHLQYCCKGNFPASTTEKVKVYTHKIV